MTRSESTGNGGYFDLILVVTLVAGTTAALLASGVPRGIEWVLGVPFLLFGPGYVLVAALFPVEPPTESSAGDRPNPPGWTARLAIALVGSVIIIGVVGVSLLIVERFRLLTVVLAIDAVVSLGVVAAWYRRRGVAVEARTDPLSAVTARRLSGHLGLSSVQTGVFVVSVLVLVSAVAFVGATPAPTDSYSEVALLDGNGTLLASDGTATIENGTENPLILRLENHEGSRTSYGIVGQFQQPGPNGTVIYTREVDRGNITIDDGARVSLKRGIDSRTTAGRVQLRYLVYKGPIPDDPSAAKADLSVRQWVDIVPEGSA